MNQSSQLLSLRNIQKGQLQQYLKILATLYISYNLLSSLATLQAKTKNYTMTT